MWLMTLSVILMLSQGYSCHSLDVGEANTDTDTVLITGTVLAANIILVISGVIILMLCLDFCQKHSGFKDFDNDAFTDDTLPPVHMPAASEFTMYPPVENTPDTVSATSPVVFEPLPDLTAETHQPVTNAWRLRPRLIHENQSRSDSTDSLDQVARNDSVQQKLKLQNLITNSRHQIPRGQLQYIKELGNGWFGKVLQGQGHDILPGHKKTKVVIQMLKEETNVQEQLAFLEEVTSYRDTDHPNVVKLLGQCVDTEPYLNVLELCPFGDLKTYLRSHRVAMESFNEKGLLLKFACDMAAGLQALHQEGFIHRDFATRNCLLASDLSVKVGDYGISEETFKEDYYLDRHGDAIPIRWLAPESLQVTPEDVIVRRITKEANVWTYGVALWEVITFGALPYGDLSNSHILRLVIVEKTVRLRKPDVPISNLDRLYQLLELCWSEPEFRPSLRELRIMLLHLLSRRTDQNTAAFDMKWNQLMPRRSPRITRAKLMSPNSLPQQNGAVKTIAGHSLPPTTLGLNSAPSVLPGDDPDLGLHELNASELNFGGRRGMSNVQMGEKGQPQKAAPVTSPINELSLEAEFSAVNVAAVSNKSESDESPTEVTGQSSDTQMDSAGDASSPVKSDDQDKNDLSVAQNTGATLNGVSDSMPDVVVSSPDKSAESTAGFLTSTPRKTGENPTGEAISNTSGGSAGHMDGSQTAVTQHAAASDYSSQSSTERSLSIEYEDRSFMGTKKFADLLQTVAMTTSIDDDDDDDTCSEASPMPLDITEEEVFKSLTNADIHTSDIQPIGRQDLADLRSGSGDETPRNTPTPPLPQSSAPLLDTDLSESDGRLHNVSEAQDESVDKSSPPSEETSSLCEKVVMEKSDSRAERQTEADE